MLKTILVPLDGSVTSELAVPFAEGIARAARAKLILIRAVRQTVSFTLGADPFRETLAAYAERELKEVAGRLTEDGLEVESHIWDADAGPGIVEATAKLQADIIVMSTHGRTGVSRAMYGSVADQVLRTASVPVLLVPATAQYRLNPPCKIVVPLDGSDLAEAALGPAIDLAEALRGQVVLVRATAPPTYWVVNEDSAEKTPDPGSGAEEARRYLEDISGSYARGPVEVSGYVTDGAAEDVIIEAARDYHAGAIAMATHGRTGLSRVMMGSVAQQVLQNASVPLLLAHPASGGQRDAGGPALTGSAHPTSGSSSQRR